MLTVGLSEVAFLVCLVHAGYKSALFALVGKVIATLSWSSEGLTTAKRGVSSLLVVPICIAVALRGSSYASVKHSCHSVVVEAASYGIEVLFGCSWFVMWITCLR